MQHPPFTGPARAGAGVTLPADAALSSDMACFKAANPGAILDDFLQWAPPPPAPQQPQQGQQGPPAAPPEWHQLWATTAACPAWEQKPLQVRRTTLWAAGSASSALTGCCMPPGCCARPRGAGHGIIRTSRQRGRRCALRPLPLAHPPPPCLPQDPVLEGERVLHELEALPPADLVDTVLAVGLAGGVALLAGARGAVEVEAVGRVARKFHRCARSRGCGGGAGGARAFRRCCCCACAGRPAAWPLPAALCWRVLRARPP